MAKKRSDQRRLYGDLAWTWPIISRKESYVQEAESFLHLIDNHSRREVRTLLHLGCGGGSLDFTLKEYVDLTGVDPSEQMLALARQANPESTYIQGDMRTVRLGQRFDSVVIADSIDYMLDEADLRAAFCTALLHLEPGGVFCTYAEATREHFQQNRTDCTVRSSGKVELTFIENYYDADPADTTYEMTFIYLIRRNGRLKVETDRHLGGIFPLQRWTDLLREVGFEVEPVNTSLENSPMFVGRKPLLQGPGDLYFRRATPADHDLVFDTWADAGRWLFDVKGITEQWSREPTEQEVRQGTGGGELYLAFRAGEQVGVVRLTDRVDALWEERPGKALYLHELAIRRKFSGQGLGRAILQWAEEMARQAGKELLRLDCMDENPGLKQYYLDAGFSPVGQHSRYKWSALFEKRVV